MSRKKQISEKLKAKYHKCEEVNTFKELLDRSAMIYKTRTAFKLKDKEGNIYLKTYEELKNDVVNLGTTLIEQGFSNKRIAVIGKNSYKWAVSYLASSIIGVVVPIDKELHSDDIINFINISETKCILGDSKNLDKILKNEEKLEDKNIKFIKFEMLEKEIENGNKLVKDGNNQFDKIKINPDELKILLFTSGTTGKAKGVCLSQRNICSNILSTYGIVKVKRNDLFFSILPMHHTYECTIGFLLPLYSGASICYCDGLKYISKNMLEYHPSVILCVPLLLEKMEQKIIKNIQKTLPDKYKKSSNFNELIDKLPFYIKAVVKNKVKNSLGGRVRVFIVGAAGINPEIADILDALGLNSLQGYGLTECAPLVAGNNDFYKRNDSAGLPIPNVEFKINNPNYEGVGEILVKGPNVMLGYYNMPEETKKVLKDGWFYTGDIGKVDENGFLYITGRCKSVIITKNGKNIYPEEIETMLNENPLISESLVLGVQNESNDEVYVNAQIFPNIEAVTEYLKGIVPTKEEIKKLVSDIIKNVNNKNPNYKHIRNFVIRDKEFEKTTTQKIKRYGDNIKKEG